MTGERAIDLYFIANPSLGIIKIGIAADVEGRRRALEHACGVGLTLLRVVEGGGAYEQELHEAFGRHRLRGEWFCPTDALVALATGTQDVQAFLTSVASETAAWRIEHNAEAMRVAQERQALAAESRAETLKERAEERRLQKEREARAKKRRDTIAAKRREADKAKQVDLDAMRKEWAAKDRTRAKPIAAPDAAAVAARRQSEFMQRSRNAALIGTTPVELGSADQ